MHLKRVLIIYCLYINIVKLRIKLRLHKCGAYKETEIQFTAQRPFVNAAN